MVMKLLVKLGLIFIVGGDFNIGNSSMINTSSAVFANLLRSLNWFVTNRLPTKVHSCMDYILVYLSHDGFHVNIIEGTFADYDSLVWRVDMNISNN